MEVAACCKMLSFENLVIIICHISITDTGFSGLQVLRCVVINFDSVLKTVLNQCHLQVIFIHVLIKFYAVLEECMPVEENLRKRFRNQMISINLLKLPSSQGIVGEKSFVASR